MCDIDTNIRQKIHRDLCDIHTKKGGTVSHRKRGKKVRQSKQNKGNALNKRKQ